MISPTNPTFKVFLNSFRLKKLSESDTLVNVYECEFDSSPEQGKEFKAIYSILWKIGVPGVPFRDQIITKEPIASQKLKGDGWILKSQGEQRLELSKESERKALEKLERNWFEKQLIQRFASRQVERYQYGGFIWWDKNQTVLKDNGWEVHTGVQLDITLTESGSLFLEIDSHYRFHCPWTLSQWIEEYPEITPKYVRNIYDNQTWQYVEVSEESPESFRIPTLGTSLADYHRNHKKSPATNEEIKQSKVIYVRMNQSSQKTGHLSARVRPILDLNILSILSEQGQPEAKKVFKEVRQSVQQRFTKAQEIVQELFNKIYAESQDIIKPQAPESQDRIKPQAPTGILLRTNPRILLTHRQNVSQAQGILKMGCLRIGEEQFGCLNLMGNGIWDKTVEKLLYEIAEASEAKIKLEIPKVKSDLPDKMIARKQFWQNWSSEQETKTILVITPWLGTEEKMRMRREALEENIALQFMRPNSDAYRGLNIVLGLLVKAKWQPVGLEPLDDENAAEIAIGFDAGTNKNLYYGTSAFAVLANGQSLGWELPETQVGERLSQQAVLGTVTNIIGRFQTLQKRLPRRILLLRDGLIQSDEFTLTIDALTEEGIAVDILSVRKSGTGRMAIASDNGQMIDAKPGTALISRDNKTFRIVTSIAKAGGSARPLQIVRYFGDAPLELLARQVDRLSMLNPASGYSSSRLPMVLHYADKMAKEVQRLGQVGILQKVDREKIFFA
jgi:hypothetical protein